MSKKLTTNNVVPSNIIPTFFLDNKYTKWYYSIVENAQNRITFNGYGELHHIIPKCLGGIDKPINKVKLTAREHFICHQILIKMNSSKNKAKMVYAFWCICCRLNNNEKIQIPSRTYEHIREQFSETHRITMSGERNPFFNKHHTIASKKLMSDNHKDVSGSNNPMFNIRLYGKDNPNFGNHKLAGSNNPNFGNHKLAGNNNPSSTWIYILSNDHDYWTFFTEKERKLCRSYFSRQKTNTIFYKNITITRISMKK